MCVYIYIYTHTIYPHELSGVWPRGVRVCGDPRCRFGKAKDLSGYSAERGCSGRGVQRMGVVVCSKIVHNTVQNTTPCFHCNPLCRM